MTDIVDIPETLPIAPFPALGSANYNQEAYDNGASVPPAMERVRAIVDAGRTNAVAAKEQADAAMDYRNTAGSHAATATTKAGEAGASVTTAQTAAGAATTQADRARDEADRAADYAASIAGGPVTSVDGLTGIVVLPPGITNIPYDSRAELRANSTGTHALVDGLGLFQYAAGSDEPDDDESCFATATGRWLLQAMHYDAVDAYVQPEIDAAAAATAATAAAATAAAAAATAAAAAAVAAKTLTGSAVCAITSVAANASVSFTGEVLGADLGDRVIATPPAQLDPVPGGAGRLNYYAWVSATNTVTVLLTNASATSGTTNTDIRTNWPITVIKA